MYISFLLLLFTYVHVIRILSENMHIICILSAVVLDMFLPNRQCRCHPYIIFSTLYISYHIKFIEWNLSQECWVVSFQDHINYLQDNLYWWFSLHVASGHCSHVICMCTCHLHIIWAYEYIIHTLSAVVLDMFLPNRQCLCHSYVILVFFIYPIIYNLVSAHCLHKHTLSMPSGCCPHMYTSFACHLYHSSYTLLSTT